MPERLITPDFYDYGERLQPSQFREAYGNVDRIFKLADESEEVMTLGPNIVNLHSAISDEWLRNTNEFKPNLRVASVPDLSLELDDIEFTSLNLFFKLGGNTSADKKWLGNANFLNDEEQLQYGFNTDGTVKMTKRSSQSPWIQSYMAHSKEGEELVEGLAYVKGLLHWQKVGSLALREAG